jgi:hypothetical protein
VLVPQPPILKMESEVILLLSHRRRKNQTKPNQTKTTTKYPKFKCNTISVSFSACRCSSVVFSSKIGRKKKKDSGDNSVNGYLRLWLPARCCQPAVAGGVIYADLRSELSSHLALQALFTQSSPVGKATATSFPLSKHTGGGDAAPAFSGRGVYLQFTWEVGLPLSPVEFSSHRHFYKLSCSLIAGHTLPLPPSPARPGLFIYRSGKDSPPSLFALYCSYCLLLSFSFFPGWGSVCPGGYADLAQGCLWEYCVP